MKTYARTIILVVSLLACSALSFASAPIAGHKASTKVAAASQATSGEFFGHVTLVQTYQTSTYVGCHALVSLRDFPGVTVAVLTKSPTLLTSLQTALQTGHLMAFWGKLETAPISPMGSGTWAVKVYSPTSVLVYNTN